MNFPRDHLLEIERIFPGAKHLGDHRCDESLEIVRDGFFSRPPILLRRLRKERRLLKCAASSRPPWCRLCTGQIVQHLLQIALIQKDVVGIVGALTSAPISRSVSRATAMWVCAWLRKNPLSRPIGRRIEAVSTTALAKVV